MSGPINAAPDYFEILQLKDVGLTIDNIDKFSDSEIAAKVSKQFRKLARKYHPDMNPGDANAERNFKSINEANSVMSDPHQRHRYIESLLHDHHQVVTSPSTFNLGVINRSFAQKFTVVIEDRSGVPVDEGIQIDWEGTTPPGWATGIPEIESHMDAPVFFPIVISFGIDAYKCTVGSYGHNIVIKVDDDIWEIPVNFTISKADEDNLRIVVDPCPMYLGDLEQGSKLRYHFIVRNVGRAVWKQPNITWKISPSWASGLDIQPPASSGMLFPKTVTFTVDTTSCPPGEYERDIVIEVEGHPFVQTIRFKTHARIPPRPVFSFGGR